MEQIFEIDRIDHAIELFGQYDGNIRRIEEAYHVSIVARGNEIKISGDAENVDRATRALRAMLSVIERGDTLDEQHLLYVMTLVDEKNEQALGSLSEHTVCLTANGTPVKPKTLGQNRYIDAIRNNTVVFGIGPAGTGKTYLAVAMAVRAFREKTAERIILTRPAVEAGEKLGFLPGDLQAKVDPYLRPLYDALFSLLGAENYQKYLERGNIEIAPLAYMRGRTLDDSFIILDEAQNTTPEQMKMFLTRLGVNSKMVVTGDITQIDLPDGHQSGLKDAVRVLKNVEDVAVCTFDRKDVVRHRLVQQIILAYENDTKAKTEKAIKKEGKKTQNGEKSASRYRK